MVISFNKGTTEEILFLIVKRSYLPAPDATSKETIYYHQVTIINDYCPSMPIQNSLNNSINVMFPGKPASEIPFSRLMTNYRHVWDNRLK
jgi:hypothetical protein